MARKLLLPPATIKLVAELLRLPNLFTVPGDILVGWCLAGQRGSFPIAGILASLCLYAAGLLFNDAFDAHVDALERPERPIPSGRIRRSTVFGWACLLSVLGGALAWQGVEMALLLLALILLYDGVLKHIPWVGVLVMGVCRGINILLGVAVSWPFGETPWEGPPLVAAIFFASYILVVSIVAKHEASPQAQITRGIRWLPFWMTLALVPLFWWSAYCPLWPVLPAALLLVPTLLSHKGIPHLVAGLLRHLIPLQLLWCLVALPKEAVAIPIFLLVCMVGAWIASRRVAGS